MAQKTDRIKLMTPVFRVSFPQLFEAKSYGDSGPKYSVVALFRKDMTGKDKELLQAMERSAEKIAIQKFGEAAYRKMRKLGTFKWPFRDGEEKDLDGYGGDVLFTTLSTKQAPGVVGRRRESLSEEDVYAGCYAHATCHPYAFDNKAKGVAFGLGNIQKLDDGEPFTMRSRAEDDFESVDSEPWEDDTDLLD
jgi:hypothetical protein